MKRELREKDLSKKSHGKMHVEDAADAVPL
jgi:hypothetical protein